MIKSNELRIGNLVEQKVNSDSGTYCIITAIGLLTESDIDAEPIPLTPEILEKAGFDIDIDGYFVIKKCLYWLDEGVIQISLGHAPLFNCPCKFVHQLQNLYFALTGEELPIEL